MSNFNNQALVSIGMPLYNEELFLEKAIDSVLTQDYQNFQLIITDNASNDTTEQICRKYATKDQRIKYYRNETNIGSAENFKKAVELAEGEYFVWVAGHDLWHPQFLSSCIEAMSQDQSIVLCHPQAIWIDTNGESLGLIPGSVDTTGLSLLSRFNVVLWGLGYCYPIYGLIKLEALKKTTLGLKIIGPDLLLLAELSLFGEFIHIQKPLLYIRRMPDFGDWNKYIEKVFNQRLSSMSASQLFWEIIEQHLQIIVKHIELSPARNSIVLSTINCLLTKYQWILNNLVPPNSSENISLDETYNKILLLANNTQVFASAFEQMILENNTEKIFSVANQKNTELSSKDHHSTTILIDGVFFQMYRTGIARVWRSLLEIWAENGFAENIIVLDRVGSAPKVAGVRYRTIPAYDYNNTDADRQMLQQICDEEGADIFISTYYTTPISTPSVFMAYDMIPEVIGYDVSEPMWREKRYGINHASSYISISQNTANDLARLFTNIPVEEVTVAHCGVDPLFTPATIEEITNFKHRYGITKPYFLLVGAGGNYKNAGLFFHAFSKLATKQGFDIVCTGTGISLGNQYREYIAGSVLHPLMFTTDEELRLAYAGAISLVYPSKYEGFGMPVAEAMACGCPVITCPNSSLPEVAGEAAIYVNDSNVDELVAALCEVQKPSVRNSLITVGLAQAQKFSWQNMAEKVSQALIEATLLRLNLREINLIVLPDWSQSEEVIFAELSEVIKTVASHHEQNNITVLIDNSNIAGEEADLILSSILMNLMMEEEIDVTETLEIVLIGKLSDVQWQVLIPKLKARIILESENQEQISQVKLSDLMAIKTDDILSYNFNG